MPTKKLPISPDVSVVLQQSVISPCQSTGGWILLLPEQLPRDLYERTNKILAANGGQWNRKSKGHLFSHDPRAIFAEALARGVLEVERDGWFPTPAAIIQLMLEHSPWRGGWILEPSAGEGAIVQEITKRWPIATDRITCVEKNVNRMKTLQAKGYRVLLGDFLSFDTRTLSTGASDWKGFSHVYMNPPFEEGADIDHVQKAFAELEPHGELISIMSEGPFSRMDNKAVRFRAWFEFHGGTSIRLPPEAFRSSGTSVQTRMIHLIRGEKITRQQLAHQHEFAYRGNP